MSRSKKSIIGQELADMPLEAMAVEAMSGTGLSMRQGLICAGGVKLTVMMSVSDPNDTEPSVVEQIFREVQAQLTAPETPQTNGDAA